MDLTATAEDLPRIDAALDAAVDARDRALTWILEHVGADGAPAGHTDVNGYYRVPWALAAAGRAPEAAAVLDWISRNALTGDGDLAPGVPQKGFISSLASYPLTQIALGAALLERFDVSTRVMNLIGSSYVDPLSGGVFAERPEQRSTHRTDLINTCQAGLAAIVTGRRDIADRAFRWMRTLWAAQPALPDRLYTSWTPAGLRTDVAAGESTWNLFTDFTVAHQQYYNPGMAAAFLSRYYLLTGTEEALRIARDIVALNASGAELQFDYRENTQICKLGWGACGLLDVTSSTEALDDVVRMSYWYRDSQLEQGQWRPSPFLNARPGVGDEMAKTAEHLMQLATTARSLTLLRSRLQRA